MKKSYSAIILFIILSFYSITGFAQTIILDSLGITSFCPGGTINVPFTSTLPAGTVYKVYLSNPSGNFNSQIFEIGSGTLSPIVVSFPSYYGLTASNSYKIRIVSQSPSVISNQSTELSTDRKELFILVENLIGREVKEFPTLCNGSALTATITGIGNQKDFSYKWEKDGIIQTTSASLKMTTTGNYVASIQKAGCKAAKKSIGLTVGNVGYNTLFRRGEEYQCAGGAIVFESDYYSDSVRSQWFRNGKELPRMIRDTLVATQTGKYTIEFIDKCPILEDSQNNFAKDVFFDKSIKNSIQTGIGMNNYLCGTGTYLNFYISETQQNPLNQYNYQWKKNGIDIPDANKSSLSVNSEGLYTLSLTQGDCTVISNGIGISRKDTLKLNLNIPDNYSNEICEGSITKLLSDKIPAGLNLTLYKNGIIQTRNFISYSDINETGKYNVGGTASGCVVLPSDTIKVSVGKNLKTKIINYQPSLCAGRVGQLTANPYSKTVHNYQWFKNNELIRGAIFQTYRPKETGYYKAFVSNGSCSGFSDSTKVEVGKQLAKPHFLNSLSNPIDLCENNLISFDAGSQFSNESIYDSLIWKRNKVIFEKKPFFSSFSVTGSGIYTVIGKQGECLSEESDPLEIRVRNFSTSANITGSTSIYTGQKVKLNLNFMGGDGWYYQTSDMKTIQATSLSQTTKIVAPITTQTYFITSVVNNCGIVGVTSGSATINVINPLGIDPINEIDELKIFPNPSQESLEINIEGEIKVFDFKGNQVDVIQQGKTIKTNNLNEGVYILKIIKKNGEIWAKKFVKI
ncbi:T9SS type A sorting domain-containing protein [Arcicella sp. LKC2W]|uniref:T9SS type A sorting domain-containing protein n=1 Tax=Arcicella sp. LKC2W TaxID=2984198 RepID=UPI002B201898|nr:T9SS type A sorting domain-containing protein [Arcicella sp. LKC2W]MEA5459878.1 T9SS type A sorting domain-containing protein [Arcicella sp. LKC2W]